jgi:hypothetical protein
MRALRRELRVERGTGAAAFLLNAGSLFALAIALATGCGSGLPTPVTGPHTGDEAKEVPYPPPAARPEIILKNEAGEGAVWVDGEWQWRGNRWVWRSGRWERPYPGSYYARPTGRRRPDGKLVWYEGTWHSEADRTRPSAPPKAAGPTAPANSAGVPLPTLPPGSERIDTQGDARAPGATTTAPGAAAASPGTAAPAPGTETTAPGATPAPGTAPPAPGTAPPAPGTTAPGNAAPAPGAAPPAPGTRGPAPGSAPPAPGAAKP